MEHITTDVLVIGGGAAAVRAAIEAAAMGVQVDLIDKGIVSESGSSSGALIGLSALLNKVDSEDLFFQDWLTVGGYICDQNLVWEAVTHSRQVVEELEAMGIKFALNPDGSRSLSKRAGHSVARGLMVSRGEDTRPNVVRVLRAEAERKKVRFHEGIMATRLFQNGGRIIGAAGIFKNGNFLVFPAKAVVLAAGGANRLYPNVASSIVDPKYGTTGDSFCLAFSAGVPLIDMEFAQFRDSPPGGPIFGGKYFNALGERFMERYDSVSMEKAPRHKVAGAIYREIMEGRGPIKWKVENIREVEPGMPLLDQYADKQWIDITLQFQRLTGGAQINEKTETIITGLFAAGESAGGVHGGDRMQSNAFLETQVFGSNAGRNAAITAKVARRKDITKTMIQEEQHRLASFDGAINPSEMVKDTKRIMWEQVGLSRDRTSLKQAIAKFEQFRKERLPKLSKANIFSALEAANLALTAELVARAALAREETRCTHIRSDYPNTDSNWIKHVCLNNIGNEIAVSTIPINTK